MSKDVTDLRDRLPVDTSHSGSSAGPRKSNKIKNRSARSTAGSVIRSLKCFPDVDDMIRDGAFTRDVVAFIQSSGELTNLSRDAIRYMVQTYKRDIFSDANNFIAETSKADDDIDKDDPLAHVIIMREQFFNMNKRIKMETEVETSLGKLFSTTHREFMTSSLMAEHLDNLMQKRGLMDVDRTRKVKQVGSGMSGRVDLGEVVSDPESRHKVIGILDMLMDNPDVLDGIVSLKEEKRHRSKRRKKTKKGQVAKGDEHRSESD
jgi:hypothetical protein